MSEHEYSIKLNLNKNTFLNNKNIFLSNIHTSYNKIIEICNLIDRNNKRISLFLIFSRLNNILIIRTKTLVKKYYNLKITVNILEKYATINNLNESQTFTTIDYKNIGLKILNTIGIYQVYL